MPKSQSRWSLRLLAHEKPVAVVVHPRQGLTLGRDHGGVLQALAACADVSAHHARVSVDEEGRLRVEDLASTHGTFVNDMRIQQAMLCSGDVLRLGGSAAFVVQDSEVVGRTGPIAAPGMARPDLTGTSIVRIKRALGVPDESDLGTMVAVSERRQRQRTRLALGALSILLVAAVVAIRAYPGEDQAATDLGRQFAQMQAQSRFEAAEFVRQRDQLEAAAQQIESRLDAAQKQGETQQAEVAILKQELAAARTRLASYDPVQVAARQQTRVAAVQGAVVFIDTRLRLRHAASNLLLRRGPDTPTGDVTVTFEGDGEVYEQQSSGSGFVIAADGRIVTNAHVVRPAGWDTRRRWRDGADVVGDLDYAVLFSGSDQSRPARLLRCLDLEQLDLALLQIEPFEGMPLVELPAADAPAAAVGSEVYLHGFPLGRSAMQDGDRVVVSTFRGILSRQVGPWLQVDAAVHPGNSGGPLTDAQGRVIGVVTRVQRIDESAIAPDMGYAIPAARIAELLEEPQAGAR